MNTYLDFLSTKDIITILILLQQEERISRSKLMEYLGIKIRASYVKTKVLKDNHLIINDSDIIELSLRGKFLATHLRNMNFYISGGKNDGYKTKEK